MKKEKQKTPRKIKRIKSYSHQNGTLEKAFRHDMDFAALSEIISNQNQKRT